MRRYFYICVLLFLIFYSNICRASPANGLTINTIDNEFVRGVRVEFFSGYTFGTQAVYNESGSTSATSGMLYVEPYLNGKTLGVIVSEIASNGTFTVVVNEFIGTESSSVIFNTYNYVATGTARIPLTDYCEYINLKCSASTSTASTIATITGDFVELKN